MSLGKDDQPDYAPAPQIDELMARAEAEQDEEAMADQERNSHMLVIRRADGTELVSLSGLASGNQWRTEMAPGGGVSQAYVGNPAAPILWLNAWDHEVSRDPDGTYFIVID